jgi:O-methyltransferase involved in polyketide biosynthesis
MTFMKENRPSATAQRVAMRRAAHQLLDDPKVFDDPVALRIIGKESASALQADPR